MQIVNRKIILNEKDMSKFIAIPFHLDKNYDNMKINFSYSPHQYCDTAKSTSIIIESMRRYYPDRRFTTEDALEYLPITNHITLSLDSPTRLVGTAHRGIPNQTHYINNRQSSYGFFTNAIISGDWTITLATNSILEKVTVLLSVDVYDEVIDV